MEFRLEPNEDEAELEAAEALAGLARFSGLTSVDSVRRQLVTEPPLISTVPPQDDDDDDDQAAAAAATSNEIVGFDLLCSRKNKSKRNLTEAEKEARKLRRVLANRESARQTIRRRQDMYLELTRKATDLLEENENLKKKKKLSMEKYTCLKNGNEFLKEQLAEVKKRERTQEEPPTTSESGRHCCATTPAPVPCLWPGPGTPLFVVPVPWLLSILTQQPNSGPNITQNTHHCGPCSCSGHQDLSSTRADASNTIKNTGSAFLQKDKRPEDVFAATEARRRRKELLKLKNAHPHPV